MSDKKLTKEQAHALYDSMHTKLKDMAKNGQFVAKETDTGAATTKVKSQPTSAARKATGTAFYGAKNTTRTTKGTVLSGRMSGLKGRFAKRGGLDGQGMAVLGIAVLGIIKIGLSALVASGFGTVEPAQAVVAPRPVGIQWSKQEVEVLKGLDARRVELEERRKRVEKREEEFALQERELVVRLSELKELTERLKLDREKGDKQRNTQLDQLANVYGSMNPPEAAHLLEQLDIQVALSLIERMPEKRIGQILSLMNASRALELTNLLSKRKV
jgi:flagellar motility protein MotE (MotC chaperone)